MTAGDLPSSRARLFPRAHFPPLGDAGIGGRDQSLVVLSLEEKSEMRTLTSWDLSTRKLRWAPQQFWADHWVFSPDGKLLAASCRQDKTVTLWDVNAGAVKTVKSAALGALGLVISGSATLAAAAPVPAEPIEIGNEPQLFVDDYLVDNRGVLGRKRRRRCVPLMRPRSAAATSFITGRERLRAFNDDRPSLHQRELIWNQRKTSFQ